MALRPDSDYVFRNGEKSCILTPTAIQKLDNKQPTIFAAKFIRYSTLLTSFYNTFASGKPMDDEELALLQMPEPSPNNIFASIYPGIKKLREIYSHINEDNYEILNEYLKVLEIEAAYEKPIYKAIRNKKFAIDMDLFLELVDKQLTNPNAELENNRYIGKGSPTLKIMSELQRQSAVSLDRTNYTNIHQNKDNQK